MRSSRFCLFSSSAMKSDPTWITSSYIFVISSLGRSHCLAIFSIAASGTTRSPPRSFPRPARRYRTVSPGRAAPRRRRRRRRGEPPCRRRTRGRRPLALLSLPWCILSSSWLTAVRGSDNHITEPWEVSPACLYQSPAAATRPRRQHPPGLRERQGGRAVRGGRPATPRGRRQSYFQGSGEYKGADPKVGSNCNGF